MSNEEKLQLIEQVLQAAPQSLLPETPLGEVPGWDSLNILNLQIELTVLWPELAFDALYECLTVGDILQLCGD